MNVPFFIAQRYFLAKKKNNFINVISWMSFIGVALGTASLIIVLSVFNGLEDLIKNIYNSFTPDLKIELIEGKSFDRNQLNISEIKTIIPQEKIILSIEDNALVKYLDKQTVVKIKAFDQNFDFSLSPLMKIAEGEAILYNGNQECAVVGVGVQNKLGFNIQNSYINLQCWYPKLGKNLASNPLDAFQTEDIAAIGSFALEKQYDESYIIVPLSFAARLMNYGNKVSSYEIFLRNKSSVSKVKKMLIPIVGDKFSVKTSDELHQSMLRAIEIEKLFIYIVFTFILAVCSLNIFFTLSMLAIEKRKDIKTFVSMGAPAKMIKNIFLYEGYIIGIIGSTSGLVLGFVICYLQENYGLVSMGANSSLIDAYPVKMRVLDFVFTGLTIIFITSIICYFPSKKAEEYVNENY